MFKNLILLSLIVVFSCNNTSEQKNNIPTDNCFNAKYFNALYGFKWHTDGFGSNNLFMEWTKCFHQYII